MNKGARERVSKYRDEMVSGLTNAYMLMDRSILALSSGSLGISLAFLRDSSDIRGWSAIVLLIPSWVAFGTSIISTVVSFRLSVLDHKRQVKWADKTLHIGKDAKGEPEDYYRKKVELLNVISLVSFVVAILLTVLFVSVNVVCRYNIAEVKK